MGELVEHDVLAPLGMAGRRPRGVPGDQDGTTEAGLAEDLHRLLGQDALRRGRAGLGADHRGGVHEDRAHVVVPVDAELEDEPGGLEGDDDLHLVGEGEPVRGLPALAARDHGRGCREGLRRVVERGGTWRCGGRRRLPSAGHGHLPSPEGHVRRRSGTTLVRTRRPSCPNAGAQRRREPPPRPSLTREGQPDPITERAGTFDGHAGREPGDEALVRGDDRELRDFGIPGVDQLDDAVVGRVVSWLGGRSRRVRLPPPRSATVASGRPSNTRVTGSSWVDAHSATACASRVAARDRIVPPPVGAGPHHVVPVDHPPHAVQ